jgi:hypothetical protein
MNKEGFSLFELMILMAVLGLGIILLVDYVINFAKI